MMSPEKLRALARELAGEAWDYERRHLVAQAHVRRRAAKMLVAQADTIQREDAMFEDPQAGQERQIAHSRCCDTGALPIQPPLGR